MTDVQQMQSFNICGYSNIEYKFSYKDSSPDDYFFICESVTSNNIVIFINFFSCKGWTLGLE